MGPTLPTRPSFLSAAVLALSALAGATGCFRVVTDEVKVRDPNQVSVVRTDGTVSLPAGETGSAVHQEGDFGRPFLTTPYRVVVERDGDGSVALRCDACMGVWWAHDSRPTLVTADGTVGPATGVRFVSPSLSSSVTVGADEVDLRLPSCLLTRNAKRRCEVPVETVLSTPRQNVLEIRQHRATDPVVGALLLTFGSVFAFSGATVAAGIFPRLSTRDRVLISAPVITLGAGLAAPGIWHLTAPAEDRVTRLAPTGE